MARPTVGNSIVLATDLIHRTTEVAGVVSGVGHGAVIVPREPIPNLVPDLAVEMISKSNTAEEMDRKLNDYFQADVNLVWYVQAATRAIQVYSSATSSTILQDHDCLDGGNVLPGFQLQLNELFQEPKSG